MIARRDFLRFLGAAPVALPAAIKAASAPSPIFGEAILGEITAFELPASSYGWTTINVLRGSDPLALLQQIEKEYRAIKDLGIGVRSSSVYDQMREHDLFEDSPPDKEAKSA